MRIGVHLPLLAWDDAPLTLARLVHVARAAERNSLDAISANDHLVYSRPWLDSLTALAAVLESAPTVTVMTSVALPVIRGPVALAKALSAIDVLSGGRLIAGLGPGSATADYQAVGIPFTERWSRFDEAVRTMRALWSEPAGAFAGRFYDVTGVTLSPRPARPGGPPIFVGSWGSTAGLRRVARLADGWLASAYNASPESFAANRRQLAELLAAEGREPVGFPNTLATMWLHITDDAAEEQDVLERLGVLLRRDPEQLRPTLAIGPPGHCRELITRYAEAGVDRILFWPLGDEVRQVDRLVGDVLS